VFSVKFTLLKTIYVHLLVCYLNKLQNARCNDKDTLHVIFHYSPCLAFESIFHQVDTQVARNECVCSKT